MRSLLITGTDTGVGKTFVGCGLAAALTARGKTVGVLKPAETGCELRDGELYPEDATRLAMFSRTSLPLNHICPYRFAPPRNTSTLRQDIEWGLNFRCLVFVVISHSDTQ